MNSEFYKLGSERSAIRELFEFGKMRKSEIGEENVFDFSIGNPSIAPPKAVLDEIERVVKEMPPMEAHSYTSAQGDVCVRESIANFLTQTHNFDVKKESLIMTVGASGALIGSICALCDNPLDEVIVIAPFFPEYSVYVKTANAKLVVVKTDDKFSLDLKAIESAITKNTKAIIINSPNNPTGVVYSKEQIQSLSEILQRKNKEYGIVITLISDEPYREIVFDKREVAFVPKFYDNTIVCYSYSKSISLPGERVGYVYVSEKFENSDKVYACILGALRAFAYVCAPSLFQKVIAKTQGQTSQIEIYEENGNALYEMLTEIGFECIKPQGAFYLFMKAKGKNAEEFSQKAKEFELMLVPSTSFGVDGFVRIAFCLNKSVILNSKEAFKNLYNSYKKYN